MTTTTSTADHRSLYEVTGDIKDINTLLVPRAALASPAQPVGWAIFAENGNGLVWTQNKGHAEASAKNVGLQVTPLYAAPQSAVPRNAPLYSPDDVAFPVQRSADGVDALPPELTSIARPTSTAAAEVAAPSGAAREPLSQERLQFLSGEYEDIPEEGVAFRDGWRSAEMHHGITAAQKVNNA